MNVAVIVAAGRGTRFGPEQDKLFVEVLGMPVVGHTWLRWDGHPEVDRLVLVVKAGMEPVFRELGARVGVRKPYELVAGGKERQDSVWNGLEAMPEGASLVAVQDAARPCTPSSLITQCFAAAREFGAAVAAQPVTDTIKESENSQTVARHLDRSKLWAVQTPQTFRVDVLRRALRAVREKGLQVTDDTAACELIGQPVRLIASAGPNPKITVPADAPLIEILLKAGG